MMASNTSIQSCLKVLFLPSVKTIMVESMALMTLLLVIDITILLLLLYCNIILFDYSYYCFFLLIIFIDTTVDYHGTACAGLILAARDNGECGVGIAYGGNKNIYIIIL